MPHITTVRALHGDVVTFDGMSSGYTVPPHLEAIFRDALATRREVRFTTTPRAILTAELLPPPSRLAFPQLVKTTALLIGLLLCVVAFGFMVGFARGGFRHFLDRLF